MDQGFACIKEGVVSVCGDKEGLESKGEVLDLIFQYVITLSCHKLWIMTERIRTLKKIK